MNYGKQAGKLECRKMATWRRKPHENCSKTGANDAFRTSERRLPAVDVWPDSV